MRRSTLLLALLPLVSACGSTVAASESASETPDATPISAFLGWDGDQEDMEAEYQASERERQDLIVSCMAAQGFEYIATDPAQWVQPDLGEIGEPEWGTREWTERYGFGVSTQMFNQSVVGPDLIGQNDAYSAQQQDWSDPNEAYVESLGEQAAVYYQALYGDDNGYEWNDSLTDEENEAAMDVYFENDYNPTGCEHESQEAINADDPSATFWNDFETELDEMYERVSADPAIIEAIADFDSCMAGLGQPYTYLDEPYNDLNAKTESIYNGVTWPGQDLDEAELAAMSDEELDAMYAQPPVLSDETRARLAEIQDEELALAIAFDDCGSRTIQEISLEVQRKLETEFLEVNADRLAAYQS